MAFTISFQRTFFHKPFMDRVDRVSAPPFNSRFQQLETDLDTVGDRFTDVNNALNSLAQGVTLERTVNFTPILTQAGPSGWDTTGIGVARKAPSATQAYGQMPVALPPGGQITSFRSLGMNTGAGGLRLALMRQDLTGGAQGAVVSYTAAGQSTDHPFDMSKAPTGGAGIDVIDPFFSYFILARLDNAGANDNVFLSGFQIVFQAR